MSDTNLTKREWEIVLSCADSGILDQDDPRTATAAVQKFADLVETDALPVSAGSDGETDT